MVKKYAKKFEKIKEIQLSKVFAKNTSKHHRKGQIVNIVPGSMQEDEVLAVEIATKKRKSSSSSNKNSNANSNTNSKFRFNTIQTPANALDSIDEEKSAAKRRKSSLARSIEK